MSVERAKFSHPIPESLSKRPVDARGYPIPHGVWQNPETGEYDFRVIDQQKRMMALKKRLCAVSGLKMEDGEYWFVGGIESYKQHLFVDGPMRREVAEFSLMTCPHLVLPGASYRRSGLEESYRPELTVTNKSEILMCAKTTVYEICTIKDFPYVKAGRWKAVGWWRGGAMTTKAVALPILESHGIRLG